MYSLNNVTRLFCEHDMISICKWNIAVKSNQRNFPIMLLLETNLKFRHNQTTGNAKGRQTIDIVRIYRTCLSFSGSSAHPHPAEILPL